MAADSPSIAALLRSAFDAEPSVKLAYLFGSQAREDAHVGSDVDVAVWSEPVSDLLAMGALAERLKIRVRREVDVVDLRYASPLLLREIVRDGVVLVNKDPELKFDFEMNVIRGYEDTKPLRALQQALLRDRVAYGSWAGCDSRTHRALARCHRSLAASARRFGC